MGIRTKILDKVKTIFGKASSYPEQEKAPPGNSILPDARIAPGTLPRGEKTASDGRPGGGDNGAMVSPAASNNNLNDRELLGQSGRPPMGHSTSESMRINDIYNSGISIGGGPVNVVNTFIHNHNPSEQIRPGLELLQKRVATSAFHNSAQRVDPPRCHPDTRVAIQKHIHNWILMDLFVRQMWIMWMHGAAGAGKSAIMQSVAELCEKAEIPPASFFFFRSDPTRNTTTSFIATLVYQLIQLIPQVQDEILGTIESNPLIFGQSLKSQLEKLIIQPLLRAREHFKGFFVVLIDGLDECTERGHQVDLIQLLGSISRSRDTPVIFLVASRREPQIEAAFVRKQIRDLVLTLPLDNSNIEQTSDDIRRYLIDKFRDIKETHLFKQYLPIDWPPDSSVEEIVSKSSGQFIFASVVINYLSSPRANPAHQLEVIRGIRLREPSSQNPFAHLDALYRHIFSQVQAPDRVLEIIAYVILSKGNKHISNIQSIFLLEPGELGVLFADTTAVIQCRPLRDLTATFLELTFLHASLPDFLLDKTRSEQYHVDLDEYRTKLLCRFFMRHPPTLDPLWSYQDFVTVIYPEQSRLLVIIDFLENAKASERLHSALMNFNCIFYSKHLFNSGSYTIGPNILHFLEQLDFGDHGEAYRHAVDVFAAEYAKHWSSLSPLNRDYIEEHSRDLVACIKEIQEQAT